LSGDEDPGHHAIGISLQDHSASMDEIRGTHAEAPAIAGLASSC
jgi:hypothetical protein